MGIFAGFLADIYFHRFICSESKMKTSELESLFVASTYFGAVN